VGEVGGEVLGEEEGEEDPIITEWCFSPVLAHHVLRFSSSARRSTPLL